MAKQEEEEEVEREDNKCGGGGWRWGGMKSLKGGRVIVIGSDQDLRLFVSVCFGARSLTRPVALQRCGGG